MADQDIYLKLLTQGLSGGAMQAVGIEGVELAQALPTELPAGALRVDTVWRMIDGRIFHLEFQTKREATLHRFLEYDTRLTHRYQAPVRTVILYGAQVASAPDTLDLGAIQYRVENVFLQHFQGEKALDIVAKHLAAQAWEPADRLRLALAFGMQTDNRRGVFSQALDLIQHMPSADEADLVVAAVLALSERTLTDEEMRLLERELSKVSKILDHVKNEGIEQGREQGREQGLERVARAMLADGDSVEKIIRVTGLPRLTVEALKPH